MEVYQSVLSRKVCQDRKVHVVVIADGASDRLRINGKSPFALAHTPHLDAMTKLAATGLMQTLYADLPKDSIVAQMGILGYDPYQYLAGGRAALERPDHLQVSASDLLFRANLVRFEAGILQSYNANCISSAKAQPLIDRINDFTRQAFPSFELHHVSDFRNILLVRDAPIDPREVICPEPHENQGEAFDFGRLIYSANASNKPLLDQLHRYLTNVYHFLCEEVQLPYAIFPWSPSRPRSWPSFKQQNHFSGKACLIGHADFLRGFGRAMNIPFFRLGNGLWDTNYKAKGKCVIDCIEQGFDFIYCHINGPDEAAHMNSTMHKITSIQGIDHFILKPILNFFQQHPDSLGSVFFCPDHYTNISAGRKITTRKNAHSLDPVPFLLWNNKKRDTVQSFTEDEVLKGYFAHEELTHLDVLKLMQISSSSRVVV